MTYEPTLTARTDFKPVPRVIIVFAALHPQARTINVVRAALGRQMPVRGGTALAVSGATGVVDMEAPAGVCAYFAEQYDADGASLGNTGSASVTMDLPATAIQNPFDPAGGVTARTGAKTGASVSIPIQVDVYTPTGSRAGRAVTGQRRGVAAALQFYADTPTASAALDAMFGTIDGNLGLPPFLCIRFSTKLAARIPLPQPLFVAVPNPTRTPVNMIGGGTVEGWDVSGTEVDPPAPILAQALLSRADLDAAYASRAARDAAYASRLAADTDFNLAGYSGSVDSGGTGGDTGGSTGTGTGGTGTGTGTTGGSSTGGSDGTAEITGSTVTDNGDGTATIT